jgi:hypothetical protein
MKSEMEMRVNIPAISTPELGEGVPLTPVFLGILKVDSHVVVVYIAVHKNKPNTVYRNPPPSFTELSFLTNEHHLCD